MTISDRDWLLGVLQDGLPHTQAEILRRSESERGHGLTVHSRAADLRKLGHDIQVTLWKANGRTYSSYRLVACVEQQSPPPSETPASCCSTDATGEQPSLFQIPASARGAYDEEAA